MKLSRTKTLADSVKKTVCCTILFDESLNEYTQSCQMYLVIRYWFNEDNVKIRYWDSKFIGHTKPADLLKLFEEALNCLAISKVLQISMDGPDVKIKFLTECKKLQLEWKIPQLIDIRFCNVHIIHGAFQSGAVDSRYFINRVFGIHAS